MVFKRAILSQIYHKASPLSNHVQNILQKTTLPEDVTVVFDMNAYNFS
jgi:hypothetical protein